MLTRTRTLAPLMAGVAMAGLCGMSEQARGDEKPPMIPRHVLFGNPDRAALKISPNGQYLSYLAPVDGVLNVWVGPRDNPSAARPVTKDTDRGVRMYFWAHTSKHVLYIQDKGGDENWHVYSVDLDAGKTIDLTPFDSVAARVQEVSHLAPDEILVSINNRTPQMHDIHRVNITTGKMSIVYKNDDFVGFLSDKDMKLHFAVKMTREGGSEVHKADGKGGWELFTRISADDTLTTDPIGLDESGENLFMLDSRGRDTAALTSVNIETGKATVLAEDDKADIAGVVGHPAKNVIQAAKSTYARRKWHILDESIKADFDYLATVTDGDFHVTSRTFDDRYWSVAYVMDAGPVRYYVYDRKAHEAKFLFTNRKNLEGLPLARMRPQVVKSRDELDLVCYYTLPLWTDPDMDGRPAKPLPTVLLVHGGPWARDSWGYNPMHQWLANRGYAVLSVNFRGSTGFGKDFINAANHEWSGKMHDDLLDAVAWAVSSGIADQKKVGIMGGSYGGYATLVGLTFTPETFACGVDIVGPSDLTTLLNTIPPYWKPLMNLFTARVGDHRTAEGRALLERCSPLNRVDKICRPLLIGQGANDPRVKQSEADQIVEAMTKRKIPVTYVLYPDEGHGFARPENRMSFTAVAEAFLAQHLGGRYEQMSEDVSGSSITIPNGADAIPHLPKCVPTGTKPCKDRT